MTKQLLLSAVAGAALFGTALPAQSAQPINAPTPAASSAPASGDSMSNSPSGSMASAAPLALSPAEHGMPAGLKGGDGAAYTGDPDLQGAISLVTAGGPVGQFSIVTALDALAGPATAKTEEDKLSKQYGAADFASFVAIQNFAVNDAVKKALAAGVKFPSPTLKGGDLAKQVVGDGLINGTYYEGYQLDHLVTHGIHEAVMVDIDKQFGEKADANYHKIADQAHYDLAQALGVTTVKLAPFH